MFTGFNGFNLFTYPDDMDTKRNSVFPKEPNIYPGYFAVRVITFLYLVVVVIRSLIHLFSPDGGAESIAGIDTSVTGGNNIIAIFHQWGAIQLLLAALLLTLFFVYRGLTPLVILVLSLDAPFRAIAGQMMELESLHTPPGEALNWPVFFTLVILFLVSLVRKRPVSNG